MKTIFTKIINREIPCYLVAENNFAIAFMDINPISKGHVLVVPKTQVDYIFDLKKKIYHDLWDFTKLVADALQKSVVCERIGVSVVGLEVPHAHIHLIPIRNVNDMNFSNTLKMSSEEMKNLAKKISRNITV